MLPTQIVRHVAAECKVAARFVRPSCAAANYCFTKDMKRTEVRAVGRERTEEEKLRRHLHGDKGAKFSKGKRMCILGDVSGCVTTLATKDNLVAEFYDD